jgi:probable HAF family extracellular repeat protein
MFGSFTDRKPGIGALHEGQDIDVENFVTMLATTNSPDQRNKREEMNMKSRYWMCFTAIPLFAALAIPGPLSAQDRQQNQPQHHHYKLIDMGTFGGPQSYIPTYVGFAISAVDNHGVLIGAADTPQPDPFLPNFCFNPDCFVSHAFRREAGGELTDLGVLPGGASSASQWMSRSGLIAGVSENGLTDPLIPGLPEIRAVLWQNGSITDLGTLEGGYESIANAVDSKGEVVGLFTNTIPDPNSISGTGYQTRAFFWQDGGMQDLGTLGGSDAAAFLINERGQVVGWSYTSSVPIICFQSIPIKLATGSFVWDKESGMTDLGGLGGICTLAEAINRRGQIVGTSDFQGDTAFHAFIWDGSMHDLGGSLGGTISQGFALNDAGVAVGFASLPGDTIIHATLWSGIGKMTDLGVVGNDPCSSAHSINAKGQVVGEGSDCFNPPDRSFFWDDGAIFDLNALIPPGSPLYVQSADAINDRGEIAAEAVDANGNQHAALLIPCDENHPSVEGCDYSSLDAATAAQSSPVRYPPSGTQRPPVTGRLNRHFPTAIRPMRP